MRYFKNSGFTLIELMVAIAIVAILAVVGLVIYGNIQKQARESKVKQDVQSIAQAFENKFDGKTNKYQEINDADFVAGAVPKMPDGESYNYSLNSDGYSFGVCASLDKNLTQCVDGSENCYCKKPSQGLSKETIAEITNNSNGQVINIPGSSSSAGNKEEKPVALDNVSASFTQGFEFLLGRTSFDHAVSTNNKRVLIVTISRRTNYKDSTSVTFDGKPLTLVGRQQDSIGNVQIWQLIDPPSGTHKVVATLGYFDQIVIGAFSLSNVSQKNPTGSFIGSTGRSSSFSLDVESKKNEYVIDVVNLSNLVTKGLKANSGQTMHYNIEDTGGNTGSGSIKPGDGMVTNMGWTIQGIAWEYSHAALVVKPSSEQD